MNRIFIIGNLTRDVNFHQMENGNSVCNFTVAVNHRGKSAEQDRTDFFNVKAWNKLAEICAQYLAKGRKVSVNGPVQLDTWTRNDGTPGACMTILANEVEFLSSYGGQNGAGNGYAGQGGAARAANTASSTANSVNTVVESEDMPF